MQYPTPCNLIACIDFPRRKSRPVCLAISWVFLEYPNVQQSEGKVMQTKSNEKIEMKVMKFKITTKAHCEYIMW